MITKHNWKDLNKKKSLFCYEILVEELIHTRTYMYYCQTNNNFLDNCFKRNFIIICIETWFFRQDKDNLVYSSFVKKSDVPLRNKNLQGNEGRN